jgi:type IV pilus biogenesis protein CpaD/CtpE
MHIGPFKVALACVFAAGTLAGCATQETKVAEAEPVTREYRTGSSIPKKEGDAKVVSKEAIERTLENRPRVIGPGGAP